MKSIQCNLKKLFFKLELRYLQSSKFIGNVMKFLTITSMLFTFSFLFASRRLELGFVFETDEPGVIIKIGIPFVFHFTFVMEFDSCEIIKRMQYDYYRLGFLLDHDGLTAQCRKSTMTGIDKGFYYYKSMDELLKGRRTVVFDYPGRGEKFCVNMVHRGGNIPAKAGTITIHYKPGTATSKFSRWFSQTHPCAEFVVLSIDPSEGSLLAESIDLWVGGKKYVGNPSDSPETVIAGIIARATDECQEFRFKDIKLMKD